MNIKNFTTNLSKNSSFSESFIETKYGNFNIRVYPDETVVLWTPFKKDQPTIVRVHSECLTGDVLGSYKCDCGEQLEKALEIIQKEGGVVIYLRQEGRGIGLFEKIKAYALQNKGVDTFEANVQLGHLPDARTYEMAAQALSDLEIETIRLLTNNPSKVTELANLGIHVVERIPLMTQANKYNQKYLEIKRQKFQHEFDFVLKNYSYQIHLDSPDQVPTIQSWVKNTIKDPLLKIDIGINASKDLLELPQAITHTQHLYSTCQKAELNPILHFSFKDCPLDHCEQVLELLHETLPSVKNIHLNDLPQISLSILEKAVQLFEHVDLPLSDQNFEIVYNETIRDLLLQKRIRIFLDNSQGKGLVESKETFMKKIDQLLQLGLNNIGLCGGFGPENLENYFKIKKYYKINLSIDAETKLKTDGKLDIQKAKDFLLQLIGVQPKLQAIQQTRHLLEISRNQREFPTEIEILGKTFEIHPHVFHPGIFPATTWYANELVNSLSMPCDFCEMGCGSGVVSCLVALADSKNRLTVIDINPHATENTKVNAERLGVRDQMQIFTSDVFDQIESTQKFDYIFWLMPFGYLEPGSDLSWEEAQVFDPGYRALRKFFQSSKQFLKENGKLLIGFSSQLGHWEVLEEIARSYNLAFTPIKSEKLQESEWVQFEFLEGRYL